MQKNQFYVFERCEEDGDYCCIRCLAPYDFISNICPSTDTCEIGIMIPIGKPDYDIMKCSIHVRDPKTGLVTKIQELSCNRYKGDNKDLITREVFDWIMQNVYDHARIKPIGVYGEKYDNWYQNESYYNNFDNREYTDFDFVYPE